MVAILRGMKNSEKTQRRSREEWLTLVDERRLSGKPMKQFAREREQLVLLVEHRAARVWTRAQREDAAGAGGAGQQPGLTRA